MLYGLTSILELTRKLFGYTQAELAKKIGKTQNYYTLIETGRATSRPVLKKLSHHLKIDEGFLDGEFELPFEFSYPFLSDFYVFYLKDNDRNAYEYILRFICRNSELIDIVFLLFRFPIGSKKRFGGKRPIMMMALRDDKNTVFLFRRHEKLNLGPSYTKGKLNLLAMAGVKGEEHDMTEYPTIEKGSPLLDVELFLDKLNDLEGPVVFQQSVNVSMDLAKKVENGSVSRADILNLFPDTEYFRKLYENHLKIEKKNSQVNIRAEQKKKGR
jgi:transcriptional regulator with XRE-family HTH domain